MTPTQRERWSRIESLAVGDPGAAITFEDKLVRETGWTRAFAQKAVGEYRRFLMLAAEAHAAGRGVSPSPAVDQVWHLHLLYTRSYWDSLCPDVLGFRLHHEPATGSATHRAELDDAYARTLRDYETLFGEAPPADLWPAKPSAQPMLKVDPAHSLVLPRATARLIAAAAVALVTVLLAALFLLAIHSGGTP